MPQPATRSRYIVPSLAPAYEALSPYAWPLVRFTTGAMLVPHGWGKILGGGLPDTAENFGNMGFEPAFLLALYIGLLELVGGTLLAIGFLTRLIAVQLVGFMATAAFAVHWSNGFFWTDKGYEYPLFWGLVALAVVFRGAGRLSVDEAIGREI